MLRRIRPVDALLWLAIAAMLGTQIMQRWWVPDGVQFNVLHICLAVTIVLLRYLTEASGWRKWAVGLPALAIVAVAFGYFYPLAAEQLIQRAGFATVTDMVISGLLLVVIFWLSWHSFGPIFPIVGLLAIAYGFLGQHVPEPFTAPPIRTERVISRIVLSGPFMGVVGQFASVVWFIIFWGMLLEVAGAGRIIVFLARKLSRTVPAGPALTTVLTSGLVGSFTGSGGNDAAITGPITIPLMRRGGYTAIQATAIEAAASTASGVTPPVLATVAFIMADQLHRPYSDIILMVLVPATVWYAALIAYVIAITARHGIRGTTSGTAPLDSLPQDTPWKLVASAVTIIGPVGILLGLVLDGYELYTAVFYAFLTLVVAAVVLRTETRLDVWWRGIVRAATMASAVSVVIVTVNILSDIMLFTGLGNRVGDIVYTMSGSSLLLASVWMLILGIFISSGMPPLVVYFVMVSTFQPVFLRFNVPVEATHFVAFYMGVLAQIHLPVAASVLVAASIANASYWRAGIETWKMTIPIHLMPFLVVSAPQLLIGVSADAPWHLGLLICAVVMSAMTMNLATGGWLGVRLGLATRLALALISGLAYVGVFLRDDLFIAASLTACLGAWLAGGIIYWQAQRRPALAREESPA